MELTRGVFLDLGSIDRGDLDLAPLDRALPEWRSYDQTVSDEAPGRIGDAEVVVTNKVVLDGPLLAGAARLKLVAVAATGTNVVDLEAAARQGVAVCNCRDYATESVTQHCLALILNLLTGQVFYRDRVRDGEWSQAQHFSLIDRPIRQARKSNLGVVGYGVLGRSVARAARRIGMEVLVAERRGCKPRGDRHAFEDVIRHADVVSIHCPLTPETRNLFDRAVLSQMKSDAILINTARGGIVNESDLADCLRAGVIGAAGIDVLTEEPPPADHPLLAGDIPNLIVTPHNAWASRAARQALIQQLAQLIHAFERGRPVNQVA